MRHLFILLTSFLILSCSKEEKNTSEIFEVDPDTCASLTRNGDSLQLCFLGIEEESRCPANAVCVWEGVARARFEFTINQVAHTIFLSTQDIGVHYSKDTIIGNYQLRLINVYPYPGTNGNPGAEVEILP